MTEVILGLGSNIGNREKYLSDAILFLSEEGGEILKKSSVWETEPWGFDADTSFLNMAILLQTSLDPEKFFAVMHSIEARLGRRRDGKGYRSRTIDIDVLFWGEEVIDLDSIVIPHPHIPERLFVLAPLNEIIPRYVHPVYKLRISELLSRCTDDSGLRRIGPLEL